MSPQVPETIWSFSMLQVDVSGVKSGCRGMSEQMYSSPVSQLTSSTFAVSLSHPVSIFSARKTKLREYHSPWNSVTDVKDWFEAALMKYWHRC